MPEEVVPPFPLPEMLSDFKSQLAALQDAMAKDFEELDRMRVENEELRRQLAQRDAAIEKLTLQVDSVKSNVK